MLTHLKLDSFKICRSTAPALLDLVTLLRSAPFIESSFIQSLLSIRQTFKCDDSNLALNRGNFGAGDTVTLGKFEILPRLPRIPE
jgi:hypothetical protein